jgi:ABC-type uncharacterized transport system substrate-binding protein
LRKRTTEWFPSLLLLAGALALVPSGARAHPHMFIDSGVDFVFDDEGRLARLRFTWIYDAFTSLYMLEDNKIDPATELGPAERARLVAYETAWPPDFQGDGYVSNGGRPVGLSGPRDATADLREDGRVVLRFLRDLDAPFRPGGEALVEVYDPTYFVEYAITETPRLEGAAAGCHARLVPFEPSAKLGALQTSLFDLPADATPADANVGALFADRITLACD